MMASLARPAGATVRLASGVLIYGVGAAALLWVANLAQLAGSASEPELIAAQVAFTGTGAAAVWALGAWLMCTALPHGSLAGRLLLAVALLPWLAVGLSFGDVFIEVCNRPGGECG